AVRDAVDEVVRLRPPTVTSRDQKGNAHRIHVVSDPAESDRLLGSLEGKELLVADGNHRSRASEHAGLDAFFAVVLSAETMNIDLAHAEAARGSGRGRALGPPRREPQPKADEDDPGPAVERAPDPRPPQHVAGARHRPGVAAQPEEGQRAEGKAERDERREGR